MKACGLLLVIGFFLVTLGANAQSKVYNGVQSGHEEAYSKTQENGQTAEFVMNLGKQAAKSKNFDAAVSYFEESDKMATDTNIKSTIYYNIALVYFEQNSYSKAREYCMKAMDMKPNYGAPYLLIGKMYAVSAKDIYPDDAVLVKAVYYAAVDKLEKARQIDPECAEEASSLISDYRAHFPSTEEIFMHPDLEKGQTISIGGWIGEQTRVR